MTKVEATYWPTDEDEVYVQHLTGGRVVIIFGPVSIFLPDHEPGSRVLPRLAEAVKLAAEMWEAPAPRFGSMVTVSA